MRIVRDGLYPVNAPAQLYIPWTGKIPLSAWHDLAEGKKGKSLRRLAKEYGASHETVRRTLQRTSMPDLA